MSVQAVEAFSPYSNVTGLGTLPTWMDAMDAQRILAYQIYEQIYWSVPDTFKLVLRGSENTSPIYVPTARTLVDTTNRYLCPDPEFIINPQLGTPEEQELCRAMFSATFARERFWSKFQANKKYGVLRGDWLWHVMANPAKAQGRRIKIETVDPAAYFPVYHPADPDRIIAVYLIEQFINDQGKVLIKRQSYIKGADPINNDGSDTTIYNAIATYDQSKWQALDDEAIEIQKPPTPLPPQITTIPVYHIPHQETPGDIFGSSELRGFERIMAAINQAVSDEEMALALEGLGMYSTDGGPPRDENNQITNWILGPGRVVEHPFGSKFERVNGVNSVAPVQEHLQFLISQLREASAASDVAVGKVDVTVAESGIALALQLGPMLAKVGIERETVTDVHNQMLHDMSHGWFPAYEGFETPCAIGLTYGTGIPENKAERFAQIMAMYSATPPLVDTAWVLNELTELGYFFPTGTAGRAMDEAQALAQATDPFASRLDEDIQEADTTGAGGAGGDA